ncbi:MAG: sulfatase-like hydrolase/transferase [Thaumarchaeota archaeon]|nr:sulfatase-like hydrolase/transferase [Nitrososphaerota archaeon]
MSNFHKLESLSNYNIILINLDGLRRDKVDLCPSLNALKERSLFFSKMKTAAPYSIASLHSIFSGVYPSRHGVNGYYKMFRFKENEIYSLAQYLKESGYYTSCDIIDDKLIPKIGFDERHIFDEKTVDFKKRHRELIKRLANKKKFFLFLDYTETHKHLVDAVIQKYKLDSINDEYYSSQKENDERYNSYLPSTDEYVSLILQSLRDFHIDDKTILIFFADHGTSIGEKNGEKFYGVYVYDYTLNVFCVLSIPNFPSQTINTQCRTIDIFPTILEISGRKFNTLKNEIQGESLFQLIENVKCNDREVFVETGGLYGPWPSPEKHNVFCVVRNNKKLIYNDSPQTWEFYDLIQDPCELKNIYQENSDEILNYKKQLLHYFKENGIITKLNENIP